MTGPHSPRLLFAKSPSGARLVRGEIIKMVQHPLRDKGLLTRGGVDGVFGSDTRSALTSFQQTAGLQVSGGICAATWEALCGPPVPSIKERALQLTADFEGHGFGKAAGDFDGAGLTWGIIGFTLKHGEVQAIINSLRQNNPGLVEEAFGPLAEKLFTMLDSSNGEQLAWARSISILPTRYDIESPWAEAFARLGREKACQEEQLRSAEKYWQNAVQDAASYGLVSERGLALCFDIRVQNGGLKKKHLDRIKLLRDRHPPQSENDMLAIIANAVADCSTRKFAEDARSRKLALATGSGVVHGAQYHIASWGVSEDVVGV